jgi:hypothetical protein
MLLTVIIMQCINNEVVFFCSIAYRKNPHSTMPSNGPVYQPTTYETRPGNAGGGLLAQTTSVSPLKVLKKPIPQMTVLVLGLLAMAAGKNWLNLGQTKCFNNFLIGL